MDSEGRQHAFLDLHEAVLLGTSQILLDGRRQVSEGKYKESNEKYSETKILNFISKQFLEDAPLSVCVYDAIRKLRKQTQEPQKTCKSAMHSLKQLSEWEAAAP